MARNTEDPRVRNADPMINAYLPINIFQTIAGGVVVFHIKFYVYTGINTA